MDKKRKIAAIAAGAAIVAGLAVYGGVSLNHKLNEVDKLNQEIAEQSQSPLPSEQPGETPQPDQSAPGGNGGEQQGQTDGEAAGQPTGNGTDAGQATGGNGTSSGGGVSGNSGQQPAATDKPATTAAPGGSGTKPQDGGSTATDKEKKKLEIDVAYAAKMDGLKASCLAASTRLAGQIAQELKADEDASLETIQSKYLSKVAAAEADCDGQFNALLGQAKADYEAAGIADMAMPSWSAQYEEAKSKARTDALAVIANAWS